MFNQHKFEFFSECVSQIRLRNISNAYIAIYIQGRNGANVLSASRNLLIFRHPIVTPRNAIERMSFLKEYLRCRNLTFDLYPFVCRFTENDNHVRVIQRLGKVTRGEVLWKYFNSSMWSVLQLNDLGLVANTHKNVLKLSTSIRRRLLLFCITFTRYHHILHKHPYRNPFYSTLSIDLDFFQIGWIDIFEYFFIQLLPRTTKAAKTKPAPSSCAKTGQLMSTSASQRKGIAEKQSGNKLLIV